MDFLKRAPARALAVALLAQACVFYAVASRGELTPEAAPLSDFPQTVAAWSGVHDYPLEKEVQDILRADDTLNRLYVDPGGDAASLFIAFFKTQRFGQTAHSPKNCLPGSGWEPTEDR